MGRIISQRPTGKSKHRPAFFSPSLYEYSTYAAAALVEDAASEARVLRRAQNLVVAAAGALREKKKRGDIHIVEESCRIVT
jgi:hypothetical protein